MGKRYGKTRKICGEKVKENKENLWGKGRGKQGKFVGKRLGENKENWQEGKQIIERRYLQRK